MMLAYRLVRLIEKHADSLTTELHHRVSTCPSLPNYSNVPGNDLKDCVEGIYRHLGDWLLGKNEKDIEARYQEIGARRAQQKVPFHELLWAIILTKETLWEYMREESIMARPTEVYGELEILQLLDQFFDRAEYWAAIGYGKSAETRPAPHAAD